MKYEPGGPARSSVIVAFAIWIYVVTAKHTKKRGGVQPKAE